MTHCTCCVCGISYDAVMPYLGGTCEMSGQSPTKSKDANPAVTRAVPKAVINTQWVCLNCVSGEVAMEAEFGEASLI